MAIKMKMISENNEAINLASEFLRDGKIISFATDTVYGIAVDATNYKAVERVYQIKKRAKNKPIVIFLPDIKIAEEFFIFDKTAKKIAEEFSAQAITLVLEKRQEALKTLAKNLNENDNFLGFRIAPTKFIAKLLKNFGGIIAVTSANISGDEAAISAFQVQKYFHSNEIDLLIDGGVCAKKIASTIIKIHNEKITILRKGELALQSIKSSS